MKKPNEPLTLYRGPITIDFAGGIRIPEATVTWDWRREPIILCNYDPTDDQRMTGNASDVFGKAHRLTLDGRAVSTWAVLHEGTSCGRHHHQKLRLIRSVVLGTVGPMRKAKVHLVNCRDFSDEPTRTSGGGYVGAGRISLRGDNWTILVDQVPNHDALVSTLNKFGGQAITHVVEIRRCHPVDFGIDDLNEVVEQLRDFIALASGSRPKVCLASGYDEDNSRIWEIWEACGPSQWSPLASWTSHHLTGQVTRAFPGYMAKCADQEWQDAIRITIDWYVQAKHRGLETALVLGQAALELMANVAYEQAVVQPRDNDKWDKARASERIRWLLREMNIDVAIPPRLDTLRAYRFPDGTPFDDGPHAVTELRNAIAHPKKQKREKFGPNVDELRYEAATMVLFFLEHVLLSTIDFDGIAAAEVTHGCLINYGPPRS